MYQLPDSTATTLNNEVNLLGLPSNNNINKPYLVQISPADEQQRQLLDLGHMCQTNATNHQTLQYYQCNYDHPEASGDDNSYSQRGNGEAIASLGIGQDLCGVSPAEPQCNVAAQTAVLLEDIGTIIKEFKLEPLADARDPRQQEREQQQQQPQYFARPKQELPTPNAEKTKEAIYEHLKRVVQGGDEKYLKMNNNNNNNHKNDQNKAQTTAADNCTPSKKQAAGSKASPLGQRHEAASVEIVEQPAKCALRFRYKCEGRSAGSLPGASSSAEQKVFPAIKINNYSGRAVVVISCVTKEAPYLAHPHNLVGKEGCKKGICTIVINDCEPQLVRSFSGLGIQCVKRKDIEESLGLRESINVDPFRQGFKHKLDTSQIDLNVVRLCFQVFIEGSTPNKCDVALAPVVSDPIHDKKAMSDLVITKLSHCSAPATGGREVILLCDRIARDDIQIRFYEENQNGELVWEHLMSVLPADVHKQVAICFRSPPYCNENIQQPVKARIQLKRPSDEQESEPRPFQFLPCESDQDLIQRKRQKMSMNHCALDNALHHHHHHHHQLEQSQQPQPSGSSLMMVGQRQQHLIEQAAQQVHQQPLVTFYQQQQQIGHLQQQVAQQHQILQQQDPPASQNQQQQQQQMQ